MRIIADDHRGELEIDSAPGIGTKITIMLPMRQASGGRPMTDKPRVLVVDDEVPIQELLKTRLKKLYEISCATYQDEAFAALEKSSFDLVLLDLKLPRNQSDMNPSPDVGIDILRHIRERKDLSSRH